MNLKTRMSYNLYEKIEYILTLYFDVTRCINKHINTFILLL